MKPILFKWPLSASLPYQVEFYTLEKGFVEPNYDMHAAVHFVILLQGSLEKWKNKYDFFLSSAWEIHGKTYSRTGATLLVVAFLPDVLLNSVICDKEKISFFLHNPAVKYRACFLRPEVRARIRAFVEKMEFLEKEMRPNTSQKKWLEIVDFISDLVTLLDSYLPNKFSRSEYAKLEPALVKLASLENVPLSVSAAAKACFLSESHFYHLFKEFYGIPFSSYELYFRLNGAASDLSGGKMNVKQAASKWGFFDASHFSRTFKKFMGIPPVKYDR
ncbi:MAG: DNA-binding transcriptional regulator AraC [Lentisphaerae bacterium ADurb.Bin242]|nr:MAG: DNA-binding transcriptional regulator AraC [Lentisphaerae bacterium ADurb.Bin242]